MQVQDSTPAQDCQIPTMADVIGNPPCQPLPFPIYPRPSWVREVGWYLFDVPVYPSSSKPIRVIKLYDRPVARGPVVLLDSPHVYTFDHLGRCECQGAFFGTRAGYCRHEQMAHIVRRFFTCPRCGRRGSDILKQFELRFWGSGMKVSSMACLACEQDLIDLRFPRLPVESSAVGWFNRYFHEHETKLLRAFMENLRKGALAEGE